MNLSSGTIGNEFEVFRFSQVNITGGAVGDSFFVSNRSPAAGTLLAPGVAEIGFLNPAQVEVILESEITREI